MDDSSSIETQGETVSQFLDFLDSDIEAFPENLSAITRDDFTRVSELTKGIDVDLSQPLDPRND